MSHVDEGLLHAWLDGAFGDQAVERVEIEAHLAGCADCRVRLEDARRERDAARQALAAVAPQHIEAPAWEQIVAEHMRRQPAAAAPPPRRPFIPLAWAATVFVALGAGWMARMMIAERPAGMAVEDMTAAPSLQESESLRDADLTRSPLAAEPQGMPESNRSTSANTATREERADVTRRATAEPAAPPAQDLQQKAAGSGAVILGAVLDSATNRPIPGAMVTLGDAVRVAVTDAAGQFRLDSVPPGRHSLEVATLGYRTQQQALSVRGDSTPPLAIRLGLDAIALDEVVVTGETRAREARPLQGAANAARSEDLLAPSLLGVPLDDAVWRAVAVSELAAGLGGAALEVDGMTPDSVQIAGIGGVMVGRSVYRVGDVRVELLQRAGGGETDLSVSGADTLVANLMRGLRFVVRGAEADAVAEVLRRLR